MDDKEADEYIVMCPVPWSRMLGYERTDAIVQLCRQFSFFRRDRLTLAEREQVLCSSSMEPEEMDSLVIYGSVGSSRKDAFLRLLRLARLTLVQDMASQVVVSPQVGDTIPSLFLCPLRETGQVRSFRRWNCVYWAMRCGLIKKIERRRELMHLHTQQIFHSISDSKGLYSSTDEDDEEIRHEESFYHAFRNLLDMEQEEQNAPIDFFRKACSETHVNISCVVSNVPTLVVLWATWDVKSIEWLRENIFNPSTTGRLKDCVNLAAAFLSSLDNDPWLHTLMQFVHVPPRAQPPKRKQIHRGSKRGQIVLISVDRDKAAALRVTNELFAEISDWSSREISILSLWGGSEGLQSEIAIQLSATTLPFFIATTPSDLCRKKFGERKSPLISFVTSEKEVEISPDTSVGQNALVEARVPNVELVDWNAIEKDDRKRLMGNISKFITSTDAPLRFMARVDRSYPMIHSPTTLIAKYLKPEISSIVSLSGVVSTTDLFKLKEELLVLLRVRNFIFDVNVMEPSAPVLTELNPLTPTRYVHGTARNITCSECNEVILIDDDYHYRCIHCRQEEGVVCIKCFSDGKHAQHHVLLRVPLHADTALQVLWGPSNVAPLKLFCGKLVSNVKDTHVGVYCNSCAKNIKGIRWKCALCYQYDLCNYCDRKLNEYRSKTVTSTQQEVIEGRGPVFTTSKVHPKNHYFLCVRHGCGTDGDHILKPMMAKNPLKAYVA